MAFGGSPKFPETAWSMVVAASSQTSERSSQALEKLCTIYWYPVYAYVRRRGYDAEAARDLTQEFFARLIEKNYVASAGRERGRFRSFLLLAVQRFLLNDSDWNRAAKRGGGAPIESLDAEVAEGQYRLEPAHDTTPESLYERRWALMVLDRARQRIRERHTPERFAMLAPFLTESAPRGGYQEVASALGVSEGGLKVAVHRMRQQYREALHAEIAETVSDSAQVTSEIQYLLEVLSRPHTTP